MIVRLGWAAVNVRMLPFATPQPPVTMNAFWRYNISAFPVSSPHPRDNMDLGAPFFRRSAGAIVRQRRGLEHIDEAQRLSPLQAMRGYGMTMPIYVALERHERSEPC